MKNSTHEIFRYIAGALIPIVSIMTALFGIMMLQFTIVPRILWFVIISLLTLATTPLLIKFWTWLIKSNTIPLIIILNYLAIFPCLSFAALSVNYISAARQVEDVKEATVSKVFQETRYRTKRVSRRVYTRGAPYKVFRISFSPIDYNNRILSADVPKKLYDTASRGDTLIVPAAKGALGCEVFFTNKIKLKHPKNHKHRCSNIRQQRHEAYRQHVEKILRRNQNNE